MVDTRRPSPCHGMTERNGSVRGPAVTKMARETGMHMPHLFGSVFGAKNRARPSCFPYISHDSHEQKATRNPIPIAKYDAEQTAAHFTHVPMNTLTHATTHAKIGVFWEGGVIK